MAYKNVLFRSTAREKILHGASQLADAELCPKVGDGLIRRL